MSVKNNPRNITVHTPGAPDPVVDPAADDAPEVGTTAQDVEDTAADDAFEAEVERRVQQRLAQERARQRKADPQAHLPDQSEVDATKLSRAVLTKQGWVVPAPPTADAATDALRKVLAR